MGKAYLSGLDRNKANFAALTPLSFLSRAADVFPHRTSIVYGDRRYNWGQTFERCRRIASALQKRGIGKGDTVAAILPNIPEMLELHFAVPMSGGVLNTLNTRLDAEAIAFMLDHGEAKVLFTDREFTRIVEKALTLLKGPKPLVVDIDDSLFEGGRLLGEIDYEALLAEGDADFESLPPDDEWDAIALNYTSGTTGNPKGVVYHHRGAYLNAINNIVSWGMPPHSVYLWTLPMFHCNGWCFPWTVAANAGVNVCLRRIDPKSVFDLIRAEKVSHFCGAPIVHGMLINADPAIQSGISHQVSALIAGAAPPASIIEGMERLGISITHVYGLTETYGPASVCSKQGEWESESLARRAELNARQGVRSLLQEGIDVIDTTHFTPVPHDGQTMGEIVFRGNIVMKGYLKNERATQECFAGGWFRTGDLAVIDPDGYIKIKDRSKDVIISGGENISSIEVEDVLYRHKDVLAAAVVAAPDEKWGEVPCAFLELREGAHPSQEEFLEFCRAHMARFKVPKKFIFGPLPKTSTGKIQKFILREAARATDAIG
ncbi:acyl-CoA synthetase [uncultured Rhodoblastus sp.]|uniref:acyl-CoA synthetase n=1 Tax=uncultured Rhodoblastus sp. TaxID=543037 RepID=UPI0025D3EA93|nr:acyl-CoA synthetase [uncultured Rhodoblastus sp.]